MYFDKELNTIQTWIKSVAGLNSWKLSEAKPKLARPVILFETPDRIKDRDVGRYSYVTAVRQYGKLFVSSLDDGIKYQEQLTCDLADKCNTLAIVNGPEGEPQGYLKAVAIKFDNTATLDIPFSIAYEVAYSRTRPAEAPAATAVYNRARVTP